MVVPRIVLCDVDACRLPENHRGKHDARPESAWSFLDAKDADKINKAGYATPRGGSKGAYQNHVYRNSRVIVPYERLGEVDLSTYTDGYVIRLFPHQYFESRRKRRPEFAVSGAPRVGKDAFVLYRSHESWASFPPMPSWKVRGLTKDGVAVKRRSRAAVDTGHYVLRLPNAGAGRPARTEGPAQGIFAPEYATAELNFLAKSMLVWLIVHTRSSPYVSTDAAHVRAILENANLLRTSEHESLGVTRNGLACCPLCLRIIDYAQLHNTVTFADTMGLDNAGAQVVGATRSTEVNLFHLVPLVYATLHHKPMSIGWGHATCNTLLGQRRCYSVAELQALDVKVAVIEDDEVLTFGWMSTDRRMIRSSRGAVWVMLSDDMDQAQWAGTSVDHPAAPGTEALDAEVVFDDSDAVGGASEA